MKQEPVFSDLVISLIVISVLIMIAVGYNAYLEGISIPVEIYALFAGLLYQSFRITGNYKHVLYKFLGTFFFSMIAFIPFKDEAVYELEEHLDLWPYAFVGFYTLITAILYKDKVTERLTEGITLMLSLSVFYWVLDYGFAGIDSVPRILLLCIVLSASLFSMTHALTRLRLSRRSRLLLSIWTTLITFAFAVDFLIKIFFYSGYNSPYMPQDLYLVIQYFLLGIAAVYIMRDFMLLSGFIPGKDNYREQLKETIIDHIKRFSNEQVSRKHALLCIVYAVSAYSLNFYFNLLPRHTMVWLVIFSFPLLLGLVGLYGMRNSLKFKNELH